MTSLMDFLTNEHRGILCSLKRDRDDGILEEIDRVRAGEGARSQGGQAEI